MLNSDKPELTSYPDDSQESHFHRKNIHCIFLTTRSSGTLKPAENKSQCYRRKSMHWEKTPAEQNEVTAGFCFIISPLKENPRHETDRNLMSLWYRSSCSPVMILRWRFNLKHSEKANNQKKNTTMNKELTWAWVTNNKKITAQGDIY